MAAYPATFVAGVPATAGPRTALLVNPDSFQASRRGLGSAAMNMARDHGVPCLTAKDAGEFGAAVDALLAASPRILTVFGGDGTVHAVTTHLIESGRAGAAPPILLLGGGRTNLTAFSVNTARQRLRLLEQVIGGRAGALPVSPTRTLAVRVSGQPARYGFFLAGALVAQIIRDCHEWRTARRTAWRSSNAGTLWRLASQAARSLAGRSPFTRPSMFVQAEALGTLQGPIRMLLVSTLENFGPVLDPFTDRGRGDIRLTATRADAAGFWRHAPALARGHLASHLGPERGYLSGRTQRCVIEGGGGYCIDGQAFTAPGGAVTVEPGPPIDLVCLK